MVLKKTKLRNVNIACKHTASDNDSLENSDSKTTKEIGDVSKCESSIGSENYEDIFKNWPVNASHQRKLSKERRADLVLET